MYFRLAPFCFALCLVGCAPGLHSRMHIRQIPELSLASPDYSSRDLRVHVGRFEDIRTERGIAKVDGRVVESLSDAVLVVQQGFESYLKGRGVRLTLFDAPVLRGSLNRWFVIVTPGFPASTAHAVAIVTIEVFDSNDQPLYKATYSGETQVQHPLLSEERIQKTLSEAMAHALKEAVEDDNLMMRLRDAG